MLSHAKQRNDPELDGWMSEIRLRAIAQIGKISLEFEKAEYTKGHGTVVPSGGKYKAEQRLRRPLFPRAPRTVTSSLPHQKSSTYFEEVRTGDPGVRGVWQLATFKRLLLPGWLTLGDGLLRAPEAPRPGEREQVFPRSGLSAQAVTQEQAGDPGGISG